jgi:hypothetical protein
MTEKKPRKPPRVAKIGRVIHRSYTPDYLDYIAHTIAKEAKGEPVGTYSEHLDRLDRIAFERKRGPKLTSEELLRRLSETE